MSDTAPAKEQHKMREAWQTWADEQVRERTAALLEDIRRYAEQTIALRKENARLRTLLADHKVQP